MLLHRCILTYKILNTTIPNYLNTIFKYVKDFHTRTRPSTQNLLIPSNFKNSYGKRRLTYIGSLEYNRIPPAIRNSPTTE